MTFCVKESEIGELSTFERGQIVGARLGGAPVIKLPHY
jgi:hypothetical protein